MYHSILVPLDGSPLSERALPLARELACRTGATLHLVHVHIPPTAPMYTAGLPLLDTRLDDQASEAERDYLESLAARLRADADIQVHTTLLDSHIADSVAELIAKHTLAYHVDLVVMTSHGRNGLARFWLGSVADELVRRLPVPVLLLRANERTPGERIARLPRRILIPLDGSANAQAVLPYALALGRATQAEYTLLRVIEPVMTARHLPPDPAIRDLDDRLVDELRLDAQLALEQVAEELAVLGLVAHAKVVVAPQAALAILEEANQDGIDLIAMATHGRRGLARMVVGSVADKVLRGSLLPVLLYRPLAHPEEEVVNEMAEGMTGHR
jgi:nucleotide-binding universal stress UspA family protein